MSPMYQVRVDIPLRFHEGQKQRPALNEQVDLLAGARRSFEAAEQGLQFKVREAWVQPRRHGGCGISMPIQFCRRASSRSILRCWPIRPGNTDFVAVLNNLATKVDVEEQVHEQGLNYSLALARLEEITGVDLSGPSAADGSKVK